MSATSFSSDARVDPTGTATTQRDYARFLRGRIGDLNSAVRELLVDEDAFGVADLGQRQGLPGRWDGLEPDEQAARFDDWLADNIESGVLAPHAAAQASQWYDRAAKRALRDADRDLRRGGHADAVRGDDPDQLLRQDVYRSSADSARATAHERLDRTMTDYREDATRRAEQAIAVGTLTAVREAARDISKRAGAAKRHVTGMAAGQVVEAYSEVTIDRYVTVGGTDVPIDVEPEAEIITAGDNRVCDRCKGLADQTWTATEARGVLPAHDRCRCRWSFVDRNA